ncbi:MAG: DegV family protein [Anaerolineales bacterium]|jgi:DegV family protein with EDD domain
MENQASSAIVTDSTSDIPSEMLERYQIYQIQVDLTLDGKTYLDGFDLSRNDFYKRLPTLKDLPTTASPSSGRFQTLYERVFQDGFSEIISIHASSKLSGIFNSARLAAQDFTANIQVIDSKQLSLGLGFQVIQAARAAQRKLPREKILDEVRSIRERVRVFALLDTFTYIHRSGRVSWAKARLGSLLNIKPIVELKDGEVLNRGLARTQRNGLRYLEEFLTDLGPLEYLAILHTNAAETGQAFLDKVLPPQICEPLLVNVTTIIGTHVGPNGIGFAAVVK